MKRKSADSIFESTRFMQQDRLLHILRRLRGYFAVSTNPMEYDDVTSATKRKNRQLPVAVKSGTSLSTSAQGGTCNCRPSEHMATVRDSDAAVAPAVTNDAAFSPESKGWTTCRYCVDSTAELHRRSETEKAASCHGRWSSHLLCFKTPSFSNFEDDRSPRQVISASSSSITQKHRGRTGFSSKDPINRGPRLRNSTTRLPLFLIFGLMICCQIMRCKASSMKHEPDAICCSNDNLEVDNTEHPSTSSDGFPLTGSVKNIELTGSRNSRKTRAAKRGVPPKYLVMHTYFQRLYSRNSFFLEILKNGKVRGTANLDSAYSVVRLESIAVGVLAIYGERSKRYLAMNQKGNLYGSKNFTEECKFYEKLASGKRYFTYEAVPVVKSAGKRRKKRPRFVGFGKKGKPKRGHRIKGTSRGALFTKIPAQDKTTRNGRRGRRRGRV